MTAARSRTRSGTWWFLSMTMALNSGCENDRILNDKDAGAVIKYHLELCAGGPVEVTSDGENFAPFCEITAGSRGGENRTVVSSGSR